MRPDIKERLGKIAERQAERQAERKGKLDEIARCKANMARANSVPQLRKEVERLADIIEKLV